MSMECEMLVGLISERRRGELSPEDTRALEAHLASCARCREEARGLESVLAAVELPPVSIAELDALRSRRIGETPPRARSSGWRVPAVLVAAAAAAVLTMSVRPTTHRRALAVGAAPTQALPVLEVVPGGPSQELFPEMTSEVTDEGQATLEQDVVSLEGGGLFGNLDDG